MPIPNDPIVILLHSLDIPDDEIRVWRALVAAPDQTMLSLSKMTGISRTQMYRIVESLRKRGLVQDIIDENHRLIRATDPAYLSAIIEEKARTAELARSLFPNIRTLLASDPMAKEPGTEVKYYKGRSGIRQMILHTLNAKKEIVGYTYRRVNELVGDTFIRNWRDEFLLRDITLRDIYSDHYRDSIKQEKTHITYLLDRFPSRYLNPSILDINLQMDIYNDIVATYNWYEGDVFGVEIKNTKLAHFHKQLFELVWNLAEPAE
jgi:sugar-specific transcriptional regulator TrmB